jgi:hypothetical protein
MPCGSWALPPIGNYTLPRRYVFDCQKLYHFRKQRPAKPAGRIELLLRLDDALDGADRSALGRVVVTNALHAGSLVDDVEYAVAFADGVGGAFRQACTASDAVFEDFHCHDLCSLSVFKLSHLRYTEGFGMSNDYRLAFCGICNKRQVIVLYYR